MRKTSVIVINTTPIIAITAALGDLHVLDSLYQQVLVPYEVCHEISAGGKQGFAVAEFEAATFLKKLIRAQREGYPVIMSQAIERMRNNGIWLSERVIRMALEQAHQIS